MEGRLIVATLVLAACNNGRSPTTDEAHGRAPPIALDAATVQAPEDPAMQAFTVTAVDGLPSELATERPLWESARAPTNRQAPRVARLYRDGRLYGYSDSRRGLADGKPTRATAPLAWRLDAQVSAEAVVRIEELIRDRFATVTAPAFEAGPDAAPYTWRAWIGGIEHVVITPGGPTAGLPEPIQDIEKAIQSGIVPGAVPIEQ